MQTWGEGSHGRWTMRIRPQDICCPICSTFQASGTELNKYLQPWLSNCTRERASFLFFSNLLISFIRYIKSWYFKCKHIWNVNMLIFFKFNLKSLCQMTMKSSSLVLTFGPNSPGLRMWAVCPSSTPATSHAEKLIQESQISP